MRSFLGVGRQEALNFCHMTATSLESKPRARAFDDRAVFGHLHPMGRAFGFRLDVEDAHVGYLGKYFLTYPPFGAKYFMVEKIQSRRKSKMKHAGRKKRYEMIAAMDKVGVSQSRIGRALNMSQPNVWYYLNKSSHKLGKGMAA